MFWRREKYLKAVGNLTVDIPVLSLVTKLPELTRLHLNLMTMKEGFFHYIKHLCFA